MNGPCFCTRVIKSILSGPDMVVVLGFTRTCWLLFQGDTPVPTEPSLYLNSLPPATYFVSSFDGYADDTTVPTQVDICPDLCLKSKKVPFAMKYVAPSLRHALEGSTLWVFSPTDGSICRYMPETNM